jgi:flagellar hook-length control protein FliK
MPALNVAASPVASPSPQATTAGVAATNEGTAATPFATVLRQQMTDPDTAAANGAAAQDFSQAALLPLLLGSPELAEWIAARMAQENAVKAARTSDEQAPMPTDPPLGLAAIPLAGMVNMAGGSALVSPVTSGGNDADTAALASDTLDAVSTQATAIINTAMRNPKPADGATLPGDFAALAEAAAKAARNNMPDTARTATSPAIVAAAPDTLVTAAKPDTNLLSSIESAAGSRDTNVAAAVAALAQAAPSTRTAAGTQHIAAPVGATGWATEVGNHVSWMASHQQGHAELVLTPPQLGRIEISLSVSGDQASALFVSANPAVRETLEGALPRLREILADAGITLGQAQVGSESPGQSANKRENGDNSPRGSNAGFIGDPTSTRMAANVGAAWSSAGRGMVDTFA